ncbi:MAG: hypothetical protein GF317_15515 [Candidatus Lokiarchaeota archaeon]|nr:hypothetical protein [Candidatus Lokiarchaeota archaeon]MBD3200971.1 hypothetical protein [Candidatus Lokiarchaeota archaeon]
MNIRKILDLKDEFVPNIKKILQDKNLIESKIFQLSTGVSNLDDLFEGGLSSNEVYLFFGANSTGKTQLCHQFCNEVYKQYSSKTKLKSQKLTLYLDTENTFRPERIQELANARDLNYKRVLQSIEVSNIMSSSALYLSLKEAEEKIKNTDIRLLIVDSVNNYYRLDRGNKEISFYSVKREFINILNKISYLTQKYNLITIITAQVAANFVKNAVIREIPVGIQYLNHFFHEEIYLSSRDKSLCYAHLVNSHSLPEKKLLFEITAEGIKDHTL